MSVKKRELRKWTGYAIVSGTFMQMCGDRCLIYLTKGFANEAMKLVKCGGSDLIEIDICERPRKGKRKDCKD